MTADNLADSAVWISTHGTYFIPYHNVKEFLETNVVISEGDIEHLQSVYHRMVEIYKCNPDVDYMLKFADIVGIKPSEPVYEWQWMYKFKNGNEFKFTGYETEDEIHHFMSTLKKDSIGYYATKIEETKRERKQ